MHAPIARETDPKLNGKPTRQIGLVVDHPLRDLDGMCLLAQILSESGVGVVLLPFYTQHSDLPNVDLDLIVLNYARPANRAVIDAAAARGIGLCVLDTEGGLIPQEGPTSASGIAAFLHESGLDKALSLYLFWGDHLRDAMLALTDLPAERAIVTGCPRFDLTRSQPDARSRRVLVNTNFPVVNSAHTNGADIDDKALKSVGFSAPQVARLAASVNVVMERMIDTVIALAKARPEREFVVRPHPFERAEPYVTAFANLSNIEVERLGTAMEALSASDCLLHVNCTTAIEASLCAVPPISLDFINEPELRAMAKLPSEISHSARSLEQALAWIDHPERLLPGVRLDRIAPYFGPLDSKSAQRTANALLETPKMAPVLDHTQSISWRTRVTAVLGATIGSVAVEKLRCLLAPARAEKGFDARMVRAKLDRIARDRGTTPAKIEQSRSALGLPIMAIKVSPK